ncbi:MAG: GIY-YIG nuclease family protein [Clostridiales bacterium]|nr:GIY-YIG nuclease family protein [Clostridiales bacterium]
MIFKSFCKFQEGYVNPSQKKAEYFDGPIKWLRATDLNNSVVFNTSKTLSQKGFESAGKSAYLFEPNTLAISKSGTIGRLGILKDYMCGNRAVINIKVDETKMSSQYVFYWLLNNQTYIQDLAVGSVQKNLYVSALEKLEIKDISIVEQNAISKILADLDKKIQTNNQINKKLEEMAQAIFKQWFVDFEFPCIPENYKFSRASKPEERLKFSESDKPDERHEVLGASKPKDFEKVCTYKRVGGLPVPDGESWFVYVLLCEDETFYKGMTKDLYRRFYEHFTGIGAEYTKAHKPVKVIHYERFATKEEARKREEELKSGYGREWIKREYVKYLQDEENIKQSIIENSGSPTQEYTSTSRFTIGSPAREYTRKSKFMIAGEMVESEMGMIPKGWEIKNIGNLAKVISKGTTPRKNDIDTATDDNIIKFLKVKDIGNDGIINLSDIEYIPKSVHLNQLKRSILEYKDILLSIAGTIGRVSYVNDELIDSNTNQAVAFVRLNDMNRYFLIVMYKFKSNEFQNSIKSKVVQGVQANISLTVIKNEKIVIPNENTLEKYNRIVNNLFDMNALINKENNRLKAIRDTLLPKLMSGEIRVPINN